MGITYIALFPFDILVRDAEVPPHLVSADEPTIRAYWPHWNEESRGRVLTMVRAATIPAVPGTQFFLVPPLDLRLEVQPTQDARFANAMRLDFSDDAATVEQATLVVQRILRHVRVSTGQWWIGHAHHDGEGLIRAGYKIDSSGTLASRDCVVGMEVETRLGTERVLEPSAFSEACAATAVGTEPPAHWDSFHDAVYFSIHRNDLRRALLDACIACDMAVLHEALRAGRAAGKPERAVRRALSDRDLLKNLRQGLASLFGPHADFSRAQPADYELIRQLWAARGLIAHGQIPTVGTGSRAQLPSRAAAAVMIEAVQRVIRQLERLPG